MAKKLSSSSFKVSVAPESGADATTYCLVPSITQVKRKADGTHLPESVSCECFSKTGNGNPVSGGGTIKFVLIFKTGSVSTEFLYKDRYKIASDIASISFRLYVGSTQVDEKTVTVVDDGQQGETGVRGRMPFPSGAFDLSATYTATDSITPIVYYEAGKTYYVMNRTCTVTGLNPATDYAQNGSSATWIPFENYKAIFTEILMANFAKLASAVFFGDYMFSQHGKDANGNGTTNYSAFDPTKIGQSDCPFTPNLMMDLLYGNGHFAGRNIYWDVNGNTFFKGSIFNNMRLLERVADGSTILLDFNTGFNLDASSLTGLFKSYTLVLPSAGDYVGANCCIWYGHCCTRVSHFHPIVRVAGNEAFVNANREDEVTSIMMKPMKLLKLIALPSYGETDNVDGVSWYIENPEDVDIIS